METVLKILDELPPLRSQKNSSIATVIGFLFGGIGLGIYFFSIIDFFILMVVGFILLGALSNFGWFLGACFAAVYGYFRVENSNKRLAQNENIQKPTA